MNYIFSIFAFVISLNVVAQDKPAYQIFDINGKKTSYSKMLQKAEIAEVILFGEHHDNSIIHWLQLELTKDLAEKKTTGFRCRND